MATAFPSALTASDIESDAGVTDLGTSSAIPDFTNNLCQMFDSQIAQLEELKMTALGDEQELRSRISSLEEKIRSLEQENRLLKEVGRVSQPSSDISMQDLKVQCEKLRMENTNLQEENASLRKEKANLQKELNSFQTGQRLNHGTTRSDMDTQVSTDEENLPVTMDHKLFMSQNVSGTDFKYVLRHLSVTDTDLTNIYDTYANDPKECCIKGLKKWKDNKGKDATVWALIRGLLKAGLRSVAEDFCKYHSFHKLHEKIGQLDSPSPRADLTPESEEDIHFYGCDSVDATVAPASPPACPDNASPLQVVVWPHLRDHNCLEDLDQELREVPDFTTEQLQKLAKSKIFLDDSQRDQFLEICQPGNALDVLNELTRRSSLPPHKDQMPVLMRLGRLLRKSERKDIRKVFTSYLKSGEIGPSVDEVKYIRGLSYRSLDKIGKKLSQPQPNDSHDWRCLASDIGISESIGLLEKKDFPGREVLDVWKTRNEATIGKLYEWAVREIRWDIVKLMEDDMS